MLEPVVIALRLFQYLGAMVLFGSSLFFLYALPRSGPASPSCQPWTRSVLLAAALLLTLASLLQIAAQSVSLSASVSEGLTFETLSAVVSFMPQGEAALLRAAVAILAAIGLLAVPLGWGRYVAASVLGSIATTSLAWMGHAAATEATLGSVHRASDVLHVLAAAVWVGALCAFLGLLPTKAASLERQVALHAALTGFAGVGSAIVGVLVITGVVNSWILVGPDRLDSLWTTPYGRLLTLKVLLFVGMCGFAASNRYRLTPALGRSLDTGPKVTNALRKSIAMETALGIAVLLVVAWYGTLQPPSAQ